MEIRNHLMKIITKKYEIPFLIAFLFVYQLKKGLLLKADRVLYTVRRDELIASNR
jgi:hypothetical protein